MQAIQIVVCQKQKKFSKLFSTFLKSALNFEELQEKSDHHMRGISEITDFENCGDINV